MTTVPIYYNIKDLFIGDKNKSIDEKYSCPTCKEIIHNKEWYQCMNGDKNCDKCWINIISDRGSKKCPSCLISIQSFTNGLSRCELINDEFANEKVSCPYSFKVNFKESARNNKLVHDKDGCVEIITIGELDKHQKKCNSRFVKCKNDQCGKISRYHQHLEHKSKCQHAIVKCEYCNMELKRSSLKKHYSLCQSIEKCTQCQAQLKKSDLQDHISQCPNATIQCKYGCGSEIKRSQQSTHLQQIDHIPFIFKVVDQLAQKIESLEKQLEVTNNSCNKILDENNIIKLNLQHNGASYSNTWIISNFQQRIRLDKEDIMTEAYHIPPYQFKLSTLFNNNLHNYLINILGPKDKKIKVKYSFKLLNFKDSSNSKKITEEEDIKINNSSFGWGFGFDVEYSLESGFLFPDGSVRLEFTIDIPKEIIRS